MRHTSGILQGIPGPLTAWYLARRQVPDPINPTWPGQEDLQRCLLASPPSPTRPAQRRSNRGTPPAAPTTTGPRWWSPSGPAPQPAAPPLTPPGRYALAY